MGDESQKQLCPHRFVSLKPAKERKRRRNLPHILQRKKLCLSCAKEITRTVKNLLKLCGINPIH